MVANPTPCTQGGNMTELELFAEELATTAVSDGAYLLPGWDVKRVRAALAQPASVPHPGSPEASAMIDSELAAHGWPSNTKNAARAGYKACSKLLAAAPQAPQPAQAVPDADAERFRWLIDDRNWNENEDTPSICTSEDVHWGDKARSLIDRHMKKD